MLERIGMNIGGVIVYHAKFRGGRTAFICGERRVTWAEFAHILTRMGIYDEFSPAIFFKSFQK